MNNTDASPTKVRPTNLKKVLGDIARHSDPDFLIDDASGSLFSELRLVHLAGLHAECIVTREEEYAAFNFFNKSELNKKLKEIYHEAISR
jgi:hypothetical protein